MEVAHASPLAPGRTHRGAGATLAWSRWSPTATLWPLVAEAFTARINGLVAIMERNALPADWAPWRVQPR